MCARGRALCCCCCIPVSDHPSLSHWWLLEEIAAHATAAAPNQSTKRHSLPRAERPSPGCLQLSTTQSCLLWPHIPRGQGFHTHTQHEDIL